MRLLNNLSILYQTLCKYHDTHAYSALNKYITIYAFIQNYWIYVSITNLGQKVPGHKVPGEKVSKESTRKNTLVTVSSYPPSLIITSRLSQTGFKLPPGNLILVWGYLPGNLKPVWSYPHWFETTPSWNFYFHYFLKLFILTHILRLFCIIFVCINFLNQEWVVRVA